jgi:uncharacterized phosphosugar-binding protein
MSASAYFDAVIATVKGLAESQADGIDRAAGMLADAIVGGQSIFAFGASHSFIVAEEMVYRTGGLMLVNPIYPHGMNLMVRPATQTSCLERVVGLGTEILKGSPIKAGDVLIIASTSGRNPVVIDMAIEAREQGIKTIGITSLAYSRGVSSRHPSGKKLMDLCDVVLDNGAPYGDAAVEVPGFAEKVAPLSTVTACTLVNAIVAEVVARLVKRGETPPVFMSANLDAGDAHNARLLKENGSRVHYLD